MVLFVCVPGWMVNLKFPCNIFLSRIKIRVAAEIELNLAVARSAVRANNIRAEYYTKKMEAAGLGASFFAGVSPPNLDDWKCKSSNSDDRKKNCLLLNLLLWVCRCLFYFSLIK